jgi:glucose-6-phosphate isomerase
MKDLTDIAGLPLSLDPQGMHFAFGPEARDPLYGTRLADQMRRLLLDHDCALPEIIYWMMRDTGLKDRAYLKASHDLRYDISIFRHEHFGREFMKTSGHYHPLQPGRDIAWPEVYEIIDGQALYVLQKVNDINLGPDEVEVEDVIILEANPRDKAIMPPNYGHVTINTLTVPMIMSNWVSSQFSSVYGGVEEAVGFAYYYLHGDGSPRWVKNPKYRKPLPALRRAVVREVPELGLTKDQPLVLSALDDPTRFDWLNNPAGNMELIWQGLEIVGEVEVGEL